MHTALFTRSMRLLALAGAVAGLAACQSAAPTATPGPDLLSVSVKAQYIKFDTTTITAKAGQAVTVDLQNTGSLEHSFVIDALGAKLEHVQAGQSASVTFTPTAAGTYTFYCDIPGHKDAGMQGTLTVTP